MSSSKDLTPSKYAGINRRLTANLVDSFILFFPSLILGFFLPPKFSLLFNLIFSALYYVCFWTYSSGQTPGKRLLSIQIVSQSSNKKLSLFQSLLRYLGYYLSTLPLFLGYLYALFDPKHQTLHDKLSRTLVIQVGNTSKATTMLVINGLIFFICLLLLLAWFFLVGVFSDITVSTLQQMIQ